MKKGMKKLEIRDLLHAIIGQPLMSTRIYDDNTKYLMRSVIYSTHTFWNSSLENKLGKSEWGLQKSESVSIWTLLFFIFYCFKYLYRNVFCFLCAIILYLCCYLFHLWRKKIYFIFIFFFFHFCCKNILCDIIICLYSKSFHLKIKYLYGKIQHLYCTKIFI